MDLQLQVGVKIVLRNKEGKILLLERNPARYPDVKGDMLDIVGGRINIGTPLLENLKREIFEETKLTLNEEPVIIAAQDILRPDKHVVRLTYMGHIEGEPVLDEDHIAYKWMTIEEASNEPSLDQYFKEVLKILK